MRKRKVNYPTARTATKRAPAPGPDPAYVRPNLATINLSAGAGKAGFKVGDRVRIEAAGTHAGEVGVVERLSAGVIPSALVRIEGGGSRQVRTIDLRPADAGAAPNAEPDAEPDAEADRELG
jgi:hypothetical protein